VDGAVIGILVLLSLWAVLRRETKDAAPPRPDRGADEVSVEDLVLHDAVNPDAAGDVGAPASGPR
jgi:hypothetical protein